MLASPSPAAEAHNWHTEKHDFCLAIDDSVVEKVRFMWCYYAQTNKNKKQTHVSDFVRDFVHK